jgi:hypothetical protein
MLSGKTYSSFCSSEQKEWSTDVSRIMSSLATERRKTTGACIRDETDVHGGNPRGVWKRMAGVDNASANKGQSK